MGVKDLGGGSVAGFWIEGFRSDQRIPASATKRVRGLLLDGWWPTRKVCQCCRDAGKNNTASPASKSIVGGDRCVTKAAKHLSFPYHSKC